MEQYTFMPWFKPNTVSPTAYFAFPSATMRFYFFFFSLPDNLIIKITHQNSTSCKECVKQLILGEVVRVTLTFRPTLKYT